MKNKTYTTDSWHFRLATRYCLQDRDDTNSFRREGSDTCHYLRRVFLGFIVACVAAVLGGAVAGCLASAVAYLWVVATSSILLDADLPAMVGLMLAGAAVIAVIIYFTSKIIEAWKEKRKIRRDIKRRSSYSSATPSKPKKDNFLVDAYKSFNNKFCSKIKFEDPNSVDYKE